MVFHKRVPLHVIRSRQRATEVWGCVVQVAAFMAEEILVGGTQGLLIYLFASQFYPCRKIMDKPKALDEHDFLKPQNCRLTCGHSLNLSFSFAHLKYSLKLVVNYLTSLCLQFSRGLLSNIWLVFALDF